MKKVNFIHIITLFFLISCSNTKVSKSSTKVFEPLPINTQVHFLTQNDSIPNFIDEVATFQHLEDNNWTWKYIKEKLIKDALKKGANIIKIDGFYLGGKNTKMHAARVLGKYYKTTNDVALNNFTDSIRTTILRNCNCSYIFLYRNEGDALLKAAFPISIYLDDKPLGKLANRKYLKIKIEEGEHFLSTNESNKNKFGINIQKNKFYYIQATQGISGGNNSIMIGNKDFIINEYLEGKLGYENVEIDNK
jgi:Protein of unknown function (DUF2846)